MPDKDPAAVFDATGDAVADHNAADHTADEHNAAQEHTAGDRDADDETLADRRARAARIRERSTELIEALGADHPLVAEALARADALEGAVDRARASGQPARGVTPGGDTDAIDLRSSADLPR